MILPEPGASPSLCGNNLVCLPLAKTVEAQLYLLKSHHAETVVLLID